MMELYFLRHGDAVTGDSWKGKDAQRPLSAEGTSVTEREAAVIARLCARVDVILCSPLLRARQTAEIVARALNRVSALEVEERLSPGFGIDELAPILRERHAAGALMLVGHEPDFSRVISACIGGGSVEVKKGSLIRVILEKTSSLAGVLAWNLPAAILAPDT
jgi:phosphohistidine phosphatase